MRVLIVTPAPAGSRKGNRITALRVARLLREAGHRAVIATRFDGQPGDVLLALHARRSAASIKRFAGDRPDAPRVLMLTGTDLYHDLGRSKQAAQSLRLATRLVVLQPAALDALPKSARGKARVIVQSAKPPRSRPKPLGRIFEVALVGHLRTVKDPFRAALAVRRLPAESRVQVVHIGAALSRAMARRAERETKLNPRYRWLGELPHWKAVRHMARCRLLISSSQMEGGSSAISEALVADVPVVASRISGHLGMLGADFPGYFPLGDTSALAALLQRAESDARFYRSLQAAAARRKPLFAPRREAQAWARLMAEFDV